MKKRSAIIFTCLAFGLAGPAFGQDAGAPNYAELVLRDESGGDYNIVSTSSTATGGYQFMYGSLIDLGYIAPGGPGSTPPKGEGAWENVEWTGKGGIYSRDEFRASTSAQDQAFAEYTQKNWNAISSNSAVGEMVNGVPLTQSGALHAAHMMGAGGYNTWASCGYQAHCLSASQAAANNMSLEQYQAHLMGRMAAGGGYDASMIIDGEWGGDSNIVIPMMGLMNWKSTSYSQIRPPGGK